jgi:hypothetical protein
MTAGRALGKAIRGEGSRPKERRLIFDDDLLINTTNTIPEIVYEIKLARTRISLHRISTVPVERKFGRIRVHVGVHQTAIELIKTMEDDEAM